MDKLRPRAIAAVVLLAATLPGSYGALTVQELAECRDSADLFDFEMSGGVLLELALYAYAILVMFVLIEEWYVPALEVVTSPDVLNVPRPLLGCTIMAAGNCLPELSISLVAILFSASADIGTGEVFGSCVFDVLAVLGAVCIKLPPGGIQLAMPLMLYFVAWSLIATAADFGLFYSDVETAWYASMGMVGAYAAFVGGLFLLNSLIPGFAGVDPAPDDGAGSGPKSDALIATEAGRALLLAPGYGATGGLAAADEGAPSGSAAADELAKLEAEIARLEAGAHAHRVPHDSALAARLMGAGRGADAHRPSSPAAPGALPTSTRLLENSRGQVGAFIGGGGEPMPSPPHSPPSPPRAASGKPMLMPPPKKLPAQEHTPLLPPGGGGGAGGGGGSGGGGATTRTLADRCMAALSAPPRALFTCTVPRPDGASGLLCGRRPWPLTLLVCIAYTLALSYGMVTIASRAICLLGIRKNSLGATILTISAGFPDLLTALVLVGRPGMAEMAASNAFGALAFNAFVALGLPWLVLGSYTDVFPPARGTWFPSLVGFVSILLGLAALCASRMRLSRGLGIALLALYAAYVVAMIADGTTRPARPPA